MGSGESVGSEDESGVSESETSGVSSEADFLWPRERAIFWSSMVIMRTW